MIKQLIAGAVALTLSAVPASSAVVVCGGVTVHELGLNSGGAVFMDAGFGMMVICGLNADSYGVAASLCTTWYATLMTAKLQNKPLNIFFDTTNSYNTSVTGTDCTSANMGNWVTRPPYWLSMP